MTSDPLTDDQVDLWPVDVPATRPNTPDRPNGRGGKTLRVKRHCNGCGRNLGDATLAEIDSCIDGHPLPDVTTECGCTTNPTAKRRGDPAFVGERQSVQSARTLEVSGPS